MICKSFQKFLLEQQCIESSVDFPKGKTLTKDVWDLSNPKHIILNKNIKSKVFKYISQIVNYFNLKITSKSVHICGSLTSNQYNDDTDLDVHILAPWLSENIANKYNEILRNTPEKIFGNDFKKSDLFIKTHPIEFYIQYRAYQDLASVGCYSFFNDIWLVGPDIVPTNFDPHEEFNSSLLNVKKWADSIALNIEKLKRKTLELEERINVGNVDKIKITEEKIKILMETLILIKNKIVKTRRNVSQPKSKIEAIKMRNSDTWKNINAFVKFLGKYGYIDKCNKISKYYDSHIKNSDKIDINSLKQLISEI